MRPSCSGMVLALTIVPGILESFLIIQLKTIFPISRLTRKLHQIRTANECFSTPYMSIQCNNAEDFEVENLKSYLMGTMLEKSNRKRKIWRYQRPAKCWRATITSDTTTRAPNRILVKQFTSKSNKPTYHETQVNMMTNVNRNVLCMYSMQISKSKLEYTKLNHYPPTKYIFMHSK